jgi:hypothetical protein
MQKTADELADHASETYRILKCTLNPGQDCGLILQIHDESGMQLELLKDRRMVGGFANSLQLSPGVYALVLNVEIYASTQDPLGRSLRSMFNENNESVKEALLTIAVTRTGHTAIRVFEYYQIDSGIEFEQAKMHPGDQLAQLIYEMKGAWNNQTTS